jgi:ribonuclease HI
MISAFTDGACSGNPGPGGWAVVFVRDGDAIAEYSGGQGYTTNNQMELAAVREALRQAPKDEPLEIVTDSRNAIGWLSQGWKRKNAQIATTCGEIDALLRARSDLPTFTYVKGHAGQVFNERADKLATAARGGSAPQAP